MRYKVELSTFNFILSIVVVIFIIALLVCQFYRTGEELYAWALLGIMLVMCGCTLFYAPLWVSFDGKSLNVERILKIKTIPVVEIQSIELYTPGGGVRRVVGSGGFFGYWGWFHQPSLGRFFSYHGKSSDCFLVRLTNGRLYLLGCSNAPAIVAAVNKALKSSIPTLRLHKEQLN